MEVQKLTEVSLADMPEDHLKWCAEMTAIFQRGVKEAIAENERLGIISDEASIYASADEEPAEAPLVSEEEAE